MNDLSAIFRDTLVEGLRRKTIISPSRWAEAYRWLGPPYPGRWSFKNFPWLREMHDSKAQINIGQKAAQMGFTEVVLNTTFFNIDIEHRDCLYILPNKTPDAGDFSSARFSAALELSPHIEKLFSDTSNVGHKRAGSANLYIRGSNSRGGLKSLPISFIVFDELEEFNKDNIPLAEARVLGQLIWHMWKISTPTAPETGINAEYLLSTQEHFCFKCPHCGKQTELVFPECVKITAEHRLDPRIKDTYYQCRECKHRLEKPTKEQILKTGKSWDLLKEAKWESLGDKNADRRGFHINNLYSSTVEPWQVASKFFAAELSHKEEEEFYNSFLGLPHVPEGSQIGDHEIRGAIGLRRKSDPVPGDIKLVTMGVDQGKWLHYVVVGWRFPKYANDLNMSAECEVLSEGKVIDFSELGDLMKRWQVNFCTIDAQPERRAAYEFACHFWGYVKLVFYSNSARGRMVSSTNDEDRHEVSVDRTSWMDLALGRFFNKTIKLPFDTREEMKSHLKALVRRHESDANGNPVGKYISTGADHLAHALLYAELALPLGAAQGCNENISAFL